MIGEKRFLIPFILGISGFLGHFFFTVLEYGDISKIGEALFFSLGFTGFVLSLYYFFKYRENNFTFLGIFFCTITILCTSLDIFIQPYDYSPSVMKFELFFFNSLIFSLIFIVLEKLFPLKQQETLRKGWFLDIMYFFINRFSIAGIIIIINFIVQTFFSFVIIDALHLIILQIPLWLQILIMLVASDFIYYWAHRAYHEIPLLWKMHVIHHSPEKMDWLAGSRIHLLEFGLTRILLTVPLIVVGFHKDAIDIFAFILAVQAAFVHANIRFPKTFLDHILVMPRFHHWHHAKSHETFYKNYAGTFVFWDVLFKTAYKKDTYPEVYGNFFGSRFPSDIVRQFVFPIYPRFALKINNNFISRCLDRIELFIEGHKEKVQIFVETHKEKTKVFVIEGTQKVQNFVKIRKERIMLKKQKLEHFIHQRKEASRKYIKRFQKTTIHNINTKKVKLIAVKKKKKKLVTRVSNIL